MIGFPNISIIGLGLLSVIGFSRFPKPPARITPFKTFDLSHLRIYFLLKFYTK
jgi:hypothetical protein